MTGNGRARCVPGAVIGGDEHSVAGALLGMDNFITMYMTYFVNTSGNEETVLLYTALFYYYC